MNGGVQLDYLLNDMDVLEFMRLNRRAKKLSSEQKAKANAQQ